MALLTIGLPVFNSEFTIFSCIKSILNQTFEDFVLIIVNDGSTDSTMDIINSFQDSRIVIVNDGINRGLPYRLNQISQMTKTEYLARMDSDDIMHYDRLNEQIKIMESNSYIDVLGTSSYSIDSNTNILGIKGSSDGNLVRTDSFIHPTIIGKTTWFLDNPYLEDANRIEDCELWFRTCRNSNFYCINLPLLYYREINKDISRNYSKGIVSMLYVFNLYVKRLAFLNAFRWQFIVLSYFSKFLVYRFIEIFGLGYLLAKRRYAKINEVTKKNAVEDFNYSICVDSSK